jgi:hypothetical protein
MELEKLEDKLLTALKLRNGRFNGIFSYVPGGKNSKYPQPVKQIPKKTMQLIPYFFNLIMYLSSDISNEC